MSNCTNCKVFEEWSGMKADIEVLKTDNQSQWDIINGVRGWIMTGMIAVIVQLIAIIGGIVIAFVKL